MKRCAAEKDMQNESENNRDCRYPDLPFSSRSRQRKIHRRLPNLDQNTIPSRSRTALYDFPLEILDMILQKSYLHWILYLPTKQRDEDVIRSIISVDVCFNQRITGKRFKRAIWRYLKDFYGKTKKISAIIRNNKNYLLENIQPNDEFIASLVSLNCITQEQSHFIQRQRYNQDKNAELLFVAKSFDEAKFSNFIKCLRQTNQNTVARIMENGGGTTKIELQSRGAICTALLESHQLHQKIENLRNGTNSFSHQTYRIISQLKDEGLEILSSRLNRRTLVIWIWCRSQTALEYIQKLNDSNELRYVLFENIEPSTSRMINIDGDHFKKTIVVCAFSISFTQRIKIQENRNRFVRSVTKLRNEIYILFGSSSVSRSHVIHAFEDQNPFHYQKEIKLKEIRTPTDIVSNERENCLYVTGLFEKCVWKLTREEDDGYKIVEWLTTDYPVMNLSVSTYGQILVLGYLNDDMLMVLINSYLMIYGSDAELIRSIQLPTGIGGPLYAVETSIGNFIILHRWVQEEGGSESNEGEMVTKWGISELCRDGRMVIRHFIPSNETQQLNDLVYFLLDSEDRVFVADSGNGRVILLDSALRWNRILTPTGEKEETGIKRPMSLYYDEEKKQLIVGGTQVNVYSLSRK